MAVDHAEKMIAEMTRFDIAAGPMPRWLLANRNASFAVLRRFFRTAPSPTIYHYTSSAALISIVANNELWLSESTYLNDRHEIEIGRQLALGGIQAKIRSETSPEVRAMLELALSNLESWPNPPVYVVCFSGEGDDLAQWRAYGGTDGPVSIELEYSPLMFGHVSEGTFNRVIYDSADQRWIFDNLLMAYADAYRDDVREPIPFEREGPQLSRTEETELVATSLYYALWQQIVICKHSAFVSEREMRFIYTAHDYSRTFRSWHPEHPTPRFRERAGRVIPYLSSQDLGFTNLKRVRDVPKLPIRSIRIGPSAEPDLIGRGIRLLLDAHGHGDVPVTVSTAPFRTR